jgi:glycosyltransferase involved in cell wall biosynthesis
MPRVSILLTCYNHLRWLPAAYDGVLGQTFDDYELLAIDDGSTDGTRDWLKEREGGKLRCIFNESNLGTYATLNVGLREANGEFVAVLNDDDLWARGKLEAQLEVFDKAPKLGIVHTGGWFIDDEGRRHPDPAPMGFPFPRTGSGDLLAELVSRNRMITSSVLVRREAFERCGEFDPSFYGYGDWHEWLRIAAEYEVGFVDEPLTFYRVHETNAAWNNPKMSEESARIREWISTWDEVLRRSGEPSMKGALAHNWAALGVEYSRLGQAAAARQALARSIRLMPTRAKSYLRFVGTYL